MPTPPRRRALRRATGLEHRRYRAPHPMVSRLRWRAAPKRGTTSAPPRPTASSGPQEGARGCPGPYGASCAAPPPLRGGAALHDLRGPLHRPILDPARLLDRLSRPATERPAAGTPARQEPATDLHGVWKSACSGAGNVQAVPGEAGARAEEEDRRLPVGAVAAVLDRQGRRLRGGNGGDTRGETCRALRTYGLVRNRMMMMPNNGFVSRGITSIMRRLDACSALLYGRGYLISLALLCRIVNVWVCAS